MTEKQMLTLRFLHAQITSNGVCPSFDEIREHLGLASKSGVSRIMDALEERGYTTRLTDRARSVELTQKCYRTLSINNYHDASQYCQTCGQPIKQGEAA